MQVITRFYSQPKTGIDLELTARIIREGGKSFKTKNVKKVVYSISGISSTGTITETPFSK